MGGVAMGHRARYYEALVADAMTCARRAGVTAWLDYGTLLGAVREAKMIPWDSDADISVLFDRTGMDRFVSELKRKGITYRVKNVAKRQGLNKYTDGFVIKRDRAYCDVFVWHRAVGEDPGIELRERDREWIADHDAYYYRARYARTDYRDDKGLFVDPEWVAESRPGKFGKFDVPLPVGAEALLTHRYGDWRTPRDQKKTPSSCRVFTAKGKR